MQNNKLIAPFVKWVGGKRQLLPEIKKLIPQKYTHYYEPFVGGGALLFHIQPRKAVINDINKELINVYRVIKNNPEKLITELKNHKNTSDYFYKVRAWDKDKKFENLSDVKKAGRVLYLNKTCYNGLYRVNSAGEFNSPFGGYKNPNIVNEATLRAVSSYLNAHKITILTKNFNEALVDIPKASFVYFDPPYDPVSKSSNFTGYTQGGFTRDHQYKLKKVCDALHKQKIKFLISNSATPLIKDLYKHKDYTIKIVKASRAINSNGKKRGEVDEVLIRNYE